MNGSPILVVPPYGKWRFLFSSLNKVVEKNIYLVIEFSPDITAHGDVSFQNGKIMNVYLIPSLSANLFPIS